MELNTHFRGPWSWDAEHELIRDDDGYALIYGGRDGDLMCTEEVGRLAAAAPDLLDALSQWAHAEITGDTEEMANARQSRDAAIARATGDQT